MSDEISKLNHYGSEIPSLTSQMEHAILVTIAQTMAEYINKLNAYSTNSIIVKAPVKALMINTGLFCLDPKIILFGSNRVKMPEYDIDTKQMVPISRPSSIVVSYTNYKGERVVRDLEGIEARYFQHEVDKLNGIDWTTRATRHEQIQSLKRTLH